MSFCESHKLTTKKSPRKLPGTIVRVMSWTIYRTIFEPNWHLFKVVPGRCMANILKLWDGEVEEILHLEVPRVFHPRRALVEILPCPAALFALPAVGAFRSAAGFVVHL